MRTRTPECRCLGCGKRLDAVGPVAPDGSDANDRPSPGDVTVCLRCGAVMMLAEDLTVRGMTEAEMDLLCNDKGYMNFLAGVVRNIRMIPKMN
jgi:hypothetical protein